MLASNIAYSAESSVGRIEPMIGISQNFSIKYPDDLSDSCGKTNELRQALRKQAQSRGEEHFII